MVNVLIYGAGAIGSFVGYLLSECEGNKGKAIENVALLGRETHIQKIKKSGLLIIFFMRANLMFSITVFQVLVI
jgi:ketopantoate reductase